MKRFYLNALLTLFVFIATVACTDNNNNYPADYVGFEKSTHTHNYDVSSSEESITIKVMAANKKDEDRKVKITINRSAIFGDAYKLVDNEVIIKAGSKSAKATVKIYPKKVIKGTYIQIQCIPQWKDAENTQLSIKLRPK